MKNSTLLKPWYALVCLLLFGFQSYSQDIHFSQFIETPLLRNPALAGIFSGDVRVQTVYRNQWSSITTPYVTGSLNGEYKLPVGHGDDFLTVGGEILYDKAGTIALTSTHILPVINYHKSLSQDRNMYLSLGFMGGVVQRRLDRSKVTTNSQYNGTGFDPSLPDGETFSSPNYSYLDGSVGASFNSQVGDNPDNNLYFGLAYHHFNKASKISFYANNSYEMTPKWVASGGFKMSVNESAAISIQGDYTKQGPFTEAIGGIIYSYKLDDIVNPRYIISGGTLLRWKDALIPVIKLECNPLSFSLSYDVNVSQLKTASQGQGGFELSLTYQTFTERSATKDAVRCPRF